MSKSMELQDKIAVVTGAGRGIGRAIGLGLAGAGAHIAVSDIDASTLGETAAAVKALGRETLVVPADMGNTQDIDRMISQAKDTFGRTDIMVNNAGLPGRHILWMYQRKTGIGYIGSTPRAFSLECNGPPGR